MASGAHDGDNGSGGPGTRNMESESEALAIARPLRSDTVARAQQCRL